MALSVPVLFITVSHRKSGRQSAVVIKVSVVAPSRGRSRRVIFHQHVIVELSRQLNGLVLFLSQLSLRFSQGFIGLSFTPMSASCTIIRYIYQAALPLTTGTVQYCNLITWKACIYLIDALSHVILVLLELLGRLLQVSIHVVSNLLCSCLARGRDRLTSSPGLHRSTKFLKCNSISFTR
jgi:hypothetical protein